jgi:hypothetical protein
MEQLQEQMESEKSASPNLQTLGKQIWSEFLGLKIEVLNSCVAYHSTVFCIHVYILESVSPSFLWRGEIPLRASAAEQSDLYCGVEAYSSCLL